MKEAALQRNVIGAGIGALKSRVVVVEQFLEKAKSSKEEYGRANVRTKSEITSYMKNLKVIISNTIDTILDSNVCKLAEFEKKDKKIMEIYIDEIETDKISLSHFIKTAEDLIHFGSDEETIKLSNGLCSQIRSLLNNFCKRNLELRLPHFTKPDYTCDEIRHYCGKIERSETGLGGDGLNLKFNTISLPMLLRTQNLTLISQFSLGKNACLDICKDQKEGVWMLSKPTARGINRTLVRYTFDGENKRRLYVGNNHSQVLKHCDETIFVKSDSTIQEISIPLKTKQDVFTYTGTCMGPCCALDTGSFLFYDTEEGKFKEIDPKKEVKTKIYLDERVDEVMRFIQLGNGTIVITTNNGLYAVDKNGEIEKMEILGDSLRGICEDKYGNIFVASCYDNRILLVDDHLRYHETVLSSIHGINKPEHITIDSSGNLWVVGSNGGCQIFDYL